MSEPTDIDNEEEEFAESTLIQAIENQIESDNPPAAKATFNKLTLVGYERDDILQMMAHVLAVEIDAILEGLVEKDLALKDLVDQGFDADTVRKVETLLYGSEWKRYQAAPGPRISTKAFWLDRRYPLVNRWRDSL